MRQKNKLTNEELFHFCEQFSILLHSGISCAEGLELMLDDSHTQRGKDFFQLLLTDFEQNGSSGIKKFRIFSGIYDLLCEYRRGNRMSG